MHGQRPYKPAASVFAYRPGPAGLLIYAAPGTSLAAMSTVLITDSQELIQDRGPPPPGRDLPQHHLRPDLALPQVFQPLRQLRRHRRVPSTPHQLACAQLRTLTPA
jgi:hypothetical protein